MRNWLENYNEGILGLFMGYAISYYAYLSIVLSEIFYIWRFLPENAMVFTILLIANCIVIAVFGILKRLCVLTRRERVVAKVYWIALTIVFVAGCFVNFLQNIVLYFLPVIFAFVWVFLRDVQTMRFATSDSKVLVMITWVFSNCLLWPVLMAFVSLTPLAIFVYAINLVFESKLLAVLIPFAFAVILPFITWFEEDFVNENVFEIGYEIVFTKRVEALIKELNVSTEVLWSEEFADAVYKLDEVSEEELEKAWIEFVQEVKRIQSVLDEAKK